MNGPLVKLDENMSRAHQELLLNAGCIADRVTDQGMSGADDQTVWQRVVAEGRFFVTLDLDFSDVRQFPPGSHPGILLLRSRSNSRDSILDILKRVIFDHPIETLIGCCVVADEKKTRIRRPPVP